MRLGLTALLIVGCRGDHAPTPTDQTLVVPPTDTATTPTTPTTTTGGTATSTAFDCASVPDLWPAPTRLSGARAYNDVEFTADGRLIGWDEPGLLASTDGTDLEAYVPGVPMVYKLGKLPGGDLVASLANGDVLRVSPSGASWPIAQGLYAYGIAVGQDGMVYATSNFDAAEPVLWRIDPDAETFEVLHTFAYIEWPRDLAFSRDFSALYVGTQWYGLVHRFGNDLTVAPTTLFTIATQWHDTVEVDACGNVYVAGLFPPELHRYSGPGDSPIVRTWSTDDYVHGFAWGEGPFDHQTIYGAVPDDARSVDAFAIGVPGASWSGSAVGGATW